MIKSLVRYNKPIIWIIFHVLLGISASFSPWPLIVWFYFVLGSSIFLVIRNSKTVFPITALMAYLISFELLARMAKTMPFIPYELGKYLLLLFLLFGIIRFKTFGNLGWIMLLCLIPSLFLDYSGVITKTDIVFNLLGPINVALIVVFLHRQTFTVKQLMGVLRMCSYPLVAVLALTQFSTPNFDNIELGLGANVAASAGFGSNQVSTVLGVGAFLFFIFWINKWYLSGFRWVDAIFIFLFTFQGLLTFSRGGMMGAILSVLIILFILNFSSTYKIRKYSLPKIGKYVIPTFMLLITAFYVADDLTRGLLTLRYQGESAGTLAGTKMKSLNTFTSGRFDILLGDINLWLEYPVFGVGVGASSHLRETVEGVVAHVELSRLLAEHGTLGAIFFLSLLYLGLSLFNKHSNPMINAILIALFVIGVFTTFHAAMRTFITPLMVGLSLIKVKENLKPEIKNNRLNKPISTSIQKETLLN